MNKVEKFKSGVKFNLKPQKLPFPNLFPNHKDGFEKEGFINTTV